LAQIVASHGRLFHDRPAEIGGVELKRYRTGLARLDHLVPSPSGGTAASGTHILDFECRRSDVGKHKGMLDQLPGADLAEIVHHLGELNFWTRAFLFFTRRNGR